MTAVLLGIDIGTSSTKGVLVTEDGGVLASVARAHGTSMPRPGWFEHDAEATWWQDVCAVSRELLARAKVEVAGVCFSGIGPCCLVADKDGRPLRPAILYGVDTRAEEEIIELTERLGADRILARGGSPLTAQAVGPKLLWLARHEPAVFERSRRLFMASSYALYRLTGEYVLDHHSASQSDPLYDVRAGGWAEDWAEDLAGPIQLPPLRWPGEIAGFVTAEGAAATGIPAGIPVAAGTIDAWSEAVSVGVREPGEAMVMYGTTMFFIAVSERPVMDRRLWGTAGAFPGTFTLAGGMAASGSVLAWGRELAGVDYRQLIDEAADVVPGAGGLLVLPYFAGERTPIFDTRARGAIFGLTLGHRRAHVFRALLEGTAYGARHNLETFQDAGICLERVVAVGGGTASELWPQIVSDVTGLDQDVPAVTIGAAYGDAFFAGVATGCVEPGTRWATVARVIEPDPRAKERYDALYALYRRAYAGTAGISHGLADLAVGDHDASGYERWMAR